MPFSTLDASSSLTAGWTDNLKTTVIKNALTSGGEKLSLNYGDTVALVNTVLNSMAASGDAVGPDLVADLQ